jgi:site-specific recombinase XerD
MAGAHVHPEVPPVVATDPAAEESAVVVRGAPADQQTVLAPVDLQGQEALVSDWMDDLEGQVARRDIAALTRDQYVRCIRPWMAYLAGIARCAQPTPPTVQGYIAAAATGGQISAHGKALSPATVNALLAAVSSLYRYAELHGRYPDIARLVRRQRVRRDGPRAALCHEQIAVLRDLLDTRVDAARAALAHAGRRRDRAQSALLSALRDRALFHLLYTTAVRLISAHRADVRDVDLHALEFHHQPKRHIDKSATSFLNQPCAEVIQAYLTERSTVIGMNPGDPLFVSHARGSEGHRLTRRNISAAMLEIFIAGGHIALTPSGAVVRPGRLSAHSIRRSAAKRTYELHGPDATRQLLGHADIRTTEHYVHMAQDETLRKAARDLG